MTTVLALDPSMSCFGWALLHVGAPIGGIVLDVGSIRTKPPKRRMPKTAQTSARLASIASQLDAVIRRCRPDRIVSEAPMGGRNAAVAKALGQSFALTVTVCELAGKPAAFVTPLAVKRAATGSTVASKDEVAAGVYNLTGWRSIAATKPAREAESDAVAVGLALTGEELGA